MLFSPLLDLHLTSPSVVENEKRDALVDVNLLRWLCTLARESAASGNLAPDWDALDRFPRTYIVACQDEFLRNDSRRLEAALSRCNVSIHAVYWQGMCHACPLLQKHLPEAREMITDICAWLDRSPRVRSAHADSLRASS